VLFHPGLGGGQHRERELQPGRGGHKVVFEEAAELTQGLEDYAGTHYQLGVAQGFNAQYDEAVESLNAAITII